MDRRSFLELDTFAMALFGSTGGVTSTLVAGQQLEGNPQGVTTFPKGNIILTNMTLIDGARSEPQRGSTVIVRDGRIVRVGTSPPTRTDRSDSRVIDLNGLWLLPGLCEAHSHLLSPLHDEPRTTDIDRYIRMGRAAVDALQVGITTLRILGSPHFSDVAWRNAFARNIFQGPRLVTAGHIIVPTAGHGASYNYGQIAISDGPEAVRHAVREQIQHDVDLIKLTITGGVFGRRWDMLDHQHFMEDELQAGLETARARGYKVAVHAGNPEAVKTAVRNGAHTIEHGYELDEEAIELMRENRTIFVPTLCVTHLTPLGAQSEFERAFVERYAMPNELFRRADERRPAHLAAFRAALDAGVSIASGADHRPMAESAFLEIELLVRNGMTPMQALTAATRVAAEACGLGMEIGTVEVGKLADLLVVADDPLESIHNLRRTAVVLKQGEIVVDRRGEI